MNSVTVFTDQETNLMGITRDGVAWWLDSRGHLQTKRLRRWPRHPRQQVEINAMDARRMHS